MVGKRLAARRGPMGGPGLVPELLVSIRVLPDYPGGEAPVLG